MKRSLCVFLAMLMLCALTACGEAPAQAQPAASAAGDGAAFTATMQLTVPEGCADGVEEVVRYLEEASEGRLKFELYYNNSLVGKADVLDSLKNGTLDITAFMPAEFPGLFPLNGTLVGVPFLGFPDEQAATDIYYRLSTENEDFMAEFEAAGIRMWSNYVCPPYQLYLSRTYTPSEAPDFNGMTIMTENAYMQDFIGEHGGAAIFAIPPDFYANLSNGVADGMIQHINCVNSMSCFELTKTVVCFGEGGICSYPLVYAVSESFWNSLPADLQELLDSVSVELCQKSYQADLALVEQVRPDLEAAADIVYLTDAQMSAWQESFSAGLDAALDSMLEQSPNIRAAYDALVSAIEGYEAADYADYHG